MKEGPELLVLAGPNGAGKSTFYASQIRHIGLRFVNADIIARELGIGAYQAAAIAEAVRHQLLAARESFVFETVFSGPRGEIVGFLERARESGYKVTLCYIGLAGAEISLERVAMRASQGGHDVADEKIAARYPRSLESLRRAVTANIDTRIYDNSELAQPFRLVALYENGKRVKLDAQLPTWLASALDRSTSR